MNCEEVKVVMESCKYSSDFISIEVTSSWGKFVRSSLHHIAKNRSFQSQANCSHFCDSVAAIEHVFPPSFNCFFEFREVRGYSILSDVFHHVSNIVEIPPLGIKWRRLRCLSCVLFRIFIDDFLLFSGFFCVFGCSSDLKIIFWENVGHWSASIELLRAFIKELFHEVQEFVVLFSIDSGIFDDETSIGFQCFGNGSAILSIVARLSEKSFDIYDGDGEG